MTNYARIINNVAIDVSREPQQFFHPELAKAFVPVPDSVVFGSTLKDGIWSPPVLVNNDPMDIQYPIVSPIEFKLLFTSQERVAIDVARQTSAVVKDFFSLIDDVRLSEVNFNLKSIRDNIQELANLNLIETERVKQIISATPV